MQLARLRIANVGPVDHGDLNFTDSEGNARRVTVLFGGGGVGKTSLLQAISNTRPGYTVALQRARNASAAPIAVADWLLGEDDPSRPHPLRLAGPNAVLDESDNESLVRRREQAFFEKRANEGGFALVAIGGARWFSRSPIVLTSPERTVLRYDVRAPAVFEDATRADLSRETKQMLIYPTLAAATESFQASRRGTQVLSSTHRMALEAAMHDVADALAKLGGYSFIGVDPTHLEPIFARENGPAITFDELPTSVRHLVAIGTLTLRTLAAAYPHRDARSAEGVALIDDVALHQDPQVHDRLLPTLRAILPRVQWIVTTSSTRIAISCHTSEVVALRRHGASQPVEVNAGESAIVH